MHMAADVSKHRADLVLLFCYIITGLLDSSAVSIWGSFVSMQTGKSDGTPLHRSISQLTHKKN